MQTIRVLRDGRVAALNLGHDERFLFAAVCLPDAFFAATFFGTTGTAAGGAPVCLPLFRGGFAIGFGGFWGGASAVGLNAWLSACQSGSQTNATVPPPRFSMLLVKLVSPTHTQCSAPAGFLRSLMHSLA